MISGYEYELNPLPGKEEIRGSTEKVTIKAEKYNNRKISLNERFGILERGYVLNPVSYPEHEALSVHLHVDKKNLNSKTQFIQQYEKEHPNGKRRSRTPDVIDKENVKPTKDRNEKSNENEKILSADQYLEEIKNQLTAENR